MEKIIIKVKTKSKSYPIIVGKSIINEIPNILKSNNLSFEKCLIIVDSKIPKNKLKIVKKRLSLRRNLFIILMQLKKIKT